MTPVREILESRVVLSVSIVPLAGLAGYSTPAPEAINDLGQIVGNFSNSTGEHAFLDSDGVTTALGALPGDVETSATGINDAGTIVGFSFNAAGMSQAFADTEGHMVATVANGETFGINDAGQQVGTATNPASGVQQAFVISGGVTTFVPLLGGATSSTGTAINRIGQVVGHDEIQTQPAGFLYSGGVTTQITDTESFGTDPTGINDAGTVVGLTAPLLDGPQGFTYADGVTTDQANLLFGINDAGQIVGSTPPGVDGSFYDAPDAILITGGTTIDLNSFLPANSGWTLQSATAINDLGQVVGDGIYNGTNEGYLLTLPDSPTLQVSTQPPPTVVAGSSFGFSAALETQTGVTVGAYTGPVTVSLASGPAGEALGGTLTAQAVDGVATFSGLTFDEAGTARLTISAPGLDPTATTLITVTPGIAERIGLFAVPTGVIAGVPFSFKAVVEYASGVLDADSSDSLVILLNSGPAGETPSGTLMANATGGIAVFSGVSLSTPGSASLLVSGGDFLPATTDAITVSPFVSTHDGVPDDFFGDGVTDPGVFGYGRYLIAQPGTDNLIDQPFGGPEDVPVVGDFFGDGKADIGVYGYGRFLIVEPGTEKVIDQPLGGPEDRPVVGDFFGDGHDDLAVYGYGRFFILDPTTGKTIDQPFGGPQDVPVVGDFFGDGKDDLGVYGYGRFLIAEPGSSSVIDQPFGGPQDKPVVGDYFGDGRSDFGVFGYGRYLVVESGTSNFIDQPFGGPDDVPVVGDFFGDGKDDLGVYGYGRYLVAEPGTSKVLNLPFGGPQDQPIEEAPAFLDPGGSVVAESVVQGQAHMEVAATTTVDPATPAASIASTTPTGPIPLFATRTSLKERRDLERSRPPRGRSVAQIEEHSRSIGSPRPHVRSISDGPIPGDRVAT